MRYHYLWLLFCSLPIKVLHLSPRYVVYSGVIWCGFGLICLVALGVKFLLQIQTDIERKALLAIGLLCVTGLDILPTLRLGIADRLWLGDLENWNEAQITSWVGALLWVPHHVAALIACFLAFLLLRRQADANRWATGPVIVAGMAFASAAGMSVYVTFTFAIAVVLWMLALTTRKAWLEAVMFVGAGAVAALWALPYLSSLRGPASNAAFVEFALRPFPVGLHFLQQMGIDIRTQFGVTVANAIFLPISYALELGFFLAVGVQRLRQLLRGRVEASANELAAWTLVMTSFLIGTFLRSGTTGTNDLGWRCFLPAQLILLLWGAIIVHDWWFVRLQRDATNHNSSLDSSGARVAVDSRHTRNDVSAIHAANVPVPFGSQNDCGHKLGRYKRPAIRQAGPCAALHLRSSQCRTPCFSNRAEQSSERVSHPAHAIFRA